MATSHRLSWLRWESRARSRRDGLATRTAKDWFVTDWMDATRAQEALEFQHYSWSDMMAELSAKFWFMRYWGRLLAPIVRQLMKRRSAYWNAPGQYADPWGAIRAKLGEPDPDKLYDRT